MGWWSSTIMGGDTPCDIIMGYEELAYDKIDVADREDDDDSEEEFSDEQRRHAIELSIPELILDAEETVQWSGPYIAFQVLAYFLLSNGCTITEELRTRLVESFNEPVEEDWDNTAERQMHLNAAKQQLLDYDIAGGTVVTFANESLFDAISQHLS